MFLAQRKTGVEEATERGLLDAILGQRTTHTPHKWNSE